MQHSGEQSAGKVLWDPNHPVDRAFARWAAGIRPLVPAGDEIRNLVGAMRGVSLLIHMCQGSASNEVVDDAVSSLYDICSSVVAIEEFVLLGGLQVVVDLLRDENRSRKVYSHTLRLLLRLLVTDELKRTVVEIGVMPALIRLSKSEAITVVQRALLVTSMCSVVQANLNEYFAIGEDLIEPLLVLCERSFDNTIIELATELLEKLVVSSQAREIFVRLHADNALLRILSHSTQVAAKEHAMATLRILCEDATIRRGILDRGGLAPLVQATQYGETRVIRKHAGIVLAEISVSDAMHYQLEDLQNGHVFAHLEKKK